jgi:hypothetical protein
VCERKGEREGG